MSKCASSDSCRHFVIHHSAFDIYHSITIRPLSMPFDRTTADAPATLRLMGSPPTRRIGLLAGAGRFPVAVGEAARGAGSALDGVGVEGLAPEELRELCDGFDYVPLAKIGRAIRFFKRRKNDTAVMAGKIEK